MSIAATDVRLEDLDLMDEDLFDDGPPHELFARMRTEAPVLRCTTPEVGEYWSVTKASDISAVSKNTDVFSYERGGIFLRENMPMPLEVMHQVLLGMDPPRHTKYRGIVQKAFTPRIVALQEQQIRDRVHKLLDDVCEQGECDLVSAISIELPLQVIAEMLGVPSEDREKLFHWTHQIEQAVSDPTVSGPEALAQVGMYLAERVAHRRANPIGEDDLTTALIDAEVDGERLNDFEIAAMFAFLMFTGSDTTRNVISGGTLALIEHPEQRQKLIDEPSLIDDTVEELIRWVAPVMWFRRTAIQDTEIRGVRVHEGDRVVTWYASGSRDEELIADPMRFDVTRDHVKHASFGGGGRHFCLGSPLARLELKLAIPAIVERLPDMERAGAIGRTRSNWVNGFTSLPVKFTPTARQGS